MATTVLKEEMLKFSLIEPATKQRIVPAQDWPHKIFKAEQQQLCNCRN